MPKDIFPTKFLSLTRLFALVFLATITPVFALDGRTAETQPNNGNLWQEVAESNLPVSGKRSLFPEQYRVFRLEQSQLQATLKALPLEWTEAARENNVVISIPLPDGSLARFRVEESQVLAKHLARAFPAWKTFQGYGLDDPTATAQLDWTSKGFHGYIFTAKGTVYIDPLQENDTEHYLVYYKHQFGQSSGGAFACKMDERFSELAGLENLAFGKTALAPTFTNGTNIRTYRIAIATTGEWARGTTASTDPQTVRTAALAAMVTTVNRLDGIFRREIAVTFQLVNPPITNEATNIIFDDPATDPYDNTDSGAQLNINQTTVTARVGTPNFDVGHLYGTGGGGVAQSPSVCDAATKAQGYSARAGFYGDPFTVDYVAHEIGHQFGASHTYNNSDMGGACTTRSTANAFEVASGSTIMSYVGICNDRNLQQYVDTGFPSFHIRSLTQMINSLNDPTEAGMCGAAGANTNSIPAVNAGNSFTVPRLTPFTLTATANDADAGDNPNLLYSWEEFDLAPSPTGMLGTPPGSFDTDTDGILRPLFRPYSPVASPSHTFPSLSFILNPAANSPAGSNNPALTYTGTHPTGLPGAVCETGITCVMGENLPTVSRAMNFRVSVRDRRGGIADAGTTVTVAGAAGPFRVTAQDAAPAAWLGGSAETVTWDVAGTNANGVNAANVNILLSTDGGLTFPLTLLANTPNDGTEQITVPNSATATARIKVEGAGNIFFDINNVNFTITGGPTPTPTPTATPTPTPTVTPTPTTGGILQFGNATFTASESAAFATITVTRAGETTGASSVDYRTNDNFTDAAGCAAASATASQRCDYATSQGSLNFAAGETSKTFTIPITDDFYVESNETLGLTLANPTGGTLGVPANATLTISDDDATAPADRLFFARLNAAQEVPTNNSTATGSGAVALNAAENEITVNLSFSGLSSAQTAAHIHGPAHPGVNAPVLFNLGTGTIAGMTFAVTPAQVAQLKAGLFYFNVHTANFGGGEIRGQILPNPAENARFFVRQQYHDFLSRVPDQAGEDFWTGQIATVAGTDLNAIKQRRVAVSNAFFFELEYQSTGAYTYRLYRAAFGNTQPFPNPLGDMDSNPYCQANPNNCQLIRAAHVPSYERFAGDRARLDAANLAATQLALATTFANRAEFVARYPAGQTAEQFVDALLGNIQAGSGANLTGQRANLIALFNSGGRGAVMFRLAEDNQAGNPINNRPFIDAEYNRAFVTTQYFGYLRRDADLPGLNFWLSVVNQFPLRSPTGQNGMVCAFITSGEYQQRFNSYFTRTNQTDCQ